MNAELIENEKHICKGRAEVQNMKNIKLSLPLFS